jgi:hypothetical protein
MSDEKAWARWHRVDMLALARHCPQEIEEQQTLLRFALDHFPVDQCLFVLADGTQAQYWENMRQGSAWITHVEQLLHQIEPCATNRTDRFYVARTAAYGCLSLQEQATRTLNPTIFPPSILPGLLYCLTLLASAILISTPA